MRRIVPLLLLATAMAASCPGSDSTDPTDDNSPVGSWTLQSINNDPLPAEVADGEFTFTVTAGSVVVNANGTFSFSETSDADGVDVTNGTWVAASAANTYTFTPNPDPEDEDQSNGTTVVDGNTMSLTIANSPGVVRRYQRN